MTHDNIVRTLFNEDYLFGEIELNVYTETSGRITCSRKIDATLTEHAEFSYSISDASYVIEYVMYYKSEYIDDDETDIIFRIDSEDKEVKEVLNYIKELER